MECDNCGTTMNETAQQATDVVLAALKDKLFLVICILVSVSCFLGLVAEGPDVFSILYTIFLWLTYAQAYKNVAHAGHLRCISGTVYAQYIVVNVAAIIVMVMGVLLAVLGMFGRHLITHNWLLLGWAYAFGMTVFCIIFAAVGIGLLVFSMFSLRYIHRFAQSVYQSLQTGTLALRHTKAVHGWLWAFGILAGIGGLGSGKVLLLKGAADCAACIIAALLVRKYFINEN